MRATVVKVSVVTLAMRQMLPAVRAAGRRAPLHEREDVESIARLALMLAWRRYDPTRGAWPAWAIRHIRRDVGRYLARQRRSEALALSAVPEPAAPMPDLERRERLRRLFDSGGEVARLRLEGRSQRETGLRLGLTRRQVAEFEQQFRREETA